MEISNEIKKLRIKNSLTQKKLSEITGIGVTTIQKYELGQRNPKIENLKKIASALNTTVESLLGWEDIRREKSEYPDISFTTIASIVYDYDELLGTIFEEAATLNDIGQINALNYIKFLNEQDDYTKE